MATYRMNRAVGVFNKGDKFTSDPDHPMIESLLGAGYAELIYEPGPKLGTPKPQLNEQNNFEAGEDDGDTVRSEPGDDQD